MDIRLIKVKWLNLPLTRSIVKTETVENIIARKGSKTARIKKEQIGTGSRSRTKLLPYFTMKARQNANNNKGRTMFLKK